MSNRLTRREMLRNTTLAGFGVWVAGQSASAIAKSANEKLNVACIGVGGRGGANMNTVAREGANIVALCDVDDERAGNAFERFPKARKYRDFRKIIDRNDVDAPVRAAMAPLSFHWRPQNCWRCAPKACLKAADSRFGCDSSMIGATFAAKGSEHLSRRGV